MISYILFAILGYIFYKWIQVFFTPGPFKYPLLGNLPQVVANYPRIHDWVYEMFVKENKRTALLLLGPERLWGTTDRDNVEHILKNKYKDYHAGKGIRGDCLRDLLGRGIFLADGKDWEEQRKTTSREFNANRFRNYMTQVFVDHTQTLCDVLAKHVASSSSSTPIDLSAKFFQLTLDAFGHIAFGVDLGGLRGAPQPFAAAFDNAQERAVQRILKSYWILWRVAKALGLGSEANMTKWLNECNTFVSGLIEKRRKEPKEELSEQVDLLSRLMDVTSNPDSTNNADEAYLRDMVMNFIVAGRDTTACGLSWLFYELAQNPEAEKRLLDEIEQELQDSVPNYDNIKNCNYLQACMSETQRLHPSVPIDPKTAQVDDVLPSGHRIQKGDTVCYVNYSMGRDAEYWAPDPLVFRPDRWLDATTGEYVRKDPYIFPAFQAGPRLCLGVDMAHLEMKIAAIMLLQKFKFQWVPQKGPMAYRV
eukprot:PhF_6_TR35026/c0_g1_i1/m.51028/K20495/CYP704B1; long-chain fatty acid omega-monooxygenase